ARFFPLDLGHLLQHGADSGGIPAPEPAFHRLKIDTFRGVEYRRRHTDLASVVADHLHILVPHRNLHRDVVVAALRHHRCAQFEYARIAGTRPDQIDNHARIETGFHAQHHGLSSGDVVDGDQEIGDVFHAAAVAELADIEDVTAECHKHRTQTSNGSGVAAGVENQVTVLCLRTSAADRTIDHHMAGPMQCARRLFFV